ncbi:MAG: hypothetical protein LPH21_09690 [Shewanella sp.]|nr:hypothetical protein [Shewanella sp.]
MPIRFVPDYAAETINSMGRYLSVDVYVNKEGYDCTNGGVSSKFVSVYIPCPNGNYTLENIETANQLDRVLELEDKVDRDGSVYRILRPRGWKFPRGMMGGNFVYTSDSRFRNHVSPYPLPIHDREE